MSITITIKIMSGVDVVVAVPRNTSSIVNVDFTITITITSGVHIVVAVPRTETVSEFGVDEPGEYVTNSTVP